MTPSQRLRTVGFNASLRTRGVALTIQPNGATVTALISTTDPDNPQPVVTSATRNQAWLSFLRTALAAVTIGIGDTLKSADGVYYRICEDRSEPNDIKQTFLCEVSKR